MVYCFCIFAVIVKQQNMFVYVLIIFLHVLLEIHWSGFSGPEGYNCYERGGGGVNIAESSLL